MGIEPTRDFVEPHTGFEDQGRHQATVHLQLVFGAVFSRVFQRFSSVFWISLGSSSRFAQVRGNTPQIAALRQEKRQARGACLLVAAERTRFTTPGALP